MQFLAIVSEVKAYARELSVKVFISKLAVIPDVVINEPGRVSKPALGNFNI